MSLTKASYSMVNGAPLNIKDFGAVGDGVTDDTAAIQAAVTYTDTVEYRQIYFPNGTYRVTASIEAINPISWVGESFSPQVYQDAGDDPPTGVTILSEVDSSYVLKCFNGVIFKRGIQLENFHFLCADTTVDGYGLLIKDIGSGYIRNVGFEKFAKQAVAFEQAQNILIENMQSTRCGEENVEAALFFGFGTNLLRFIKLEMSATPYHMNFDLCFGISFIDCDFEQGDYPAGVLPNLQTVSRYSSIRISNQASDTKFVGCYFAPPSVVNTCAKYSITPDQMEWFVDDSGSNTTYVACTFDSGFDRCKPFYKQGSGSLSSCRFNRVSSETAALIVKGYTLFTGNYVAWAADNVTNKFKGIYCEGSTIKDNILLCFDPSGTTKTSGYVFESNAADRAKLGWNDILISKYYLFHDSNFLLVNLDYFEALTKDFTGTVDSRLYNPFTYWVPTTAGTIDTITNSCANQTYKFRNLDTSAITFTFKQGAAFFNLIGGVDLATTQGQTVDIFYDAFAGVLRQET